jgi:2-oxoglutarate dehydrogenase E1 component
VASRLDQLYGSSHLYGGNAAYVELLYESYLEQPDAVPVEWRKLFDEIAGDGSADVAHSAVVERFRLLANTHYQAGQPGEAILEHKEAGVLRLINAYRVRGHQRANLDPLNLSHRPDVPDLELEFHDLEAADLDSEFDSGSLAAPNRMTLREIIELCSNAYCGSIGAEYMHITDTAQRSWLQQRLEGSAGVFSYNSEERRSILEKLTAAEGLEKYLHTKYVGQKRFSLEGSDSLIPMLHGAIQHLGSAGVREIVIGMAHRGRLNVLINILGKTSKQLFSEFEGIIKHDDALHSGDVKYHLGYSSNLATPGGEVHLALAFNPSHLEIVDPVVAGSARARQTRRKDHEHREVVPVLIHGDAAFAGQGVIMELFNMSQARGFNVGGTIHFVVNNQIGFTTSHPLDARSTLYCTEVAKLVQAPIFHVNGDDPEAALFVTQLACEFRQKFKKDVVVDLVCYRRHGHNEADEPAATQPLMYQTIRGLKTTRQLYADKLIDSGNLSAADARAMVNEYRDAMDAGEPVVTLGSPLQDQGSLSDWKAFLARDPDEAYSTAVALEHLQKLHGRISELPEGFTLHNRVEKIYADRALMAAGELPLDWGFAENIAYASLVSEGFGLRLVGQDSGRGTFFHRHAELHAQASGATYTPLATLSTSRNVNVINSLLSEEAVLGFEYGFAASDPNTLVIWEGQFGDFVNGAQVVIDQFISSGEAKWGRYCGLVMFLPHGYEGQGPEHSSARLERFMQLCSGENIQVCVPSTPAQMFHMLRRQMLQPVRKPLIVMTPKSLLRHKDSVSEIAELSSGAFQLIIDDNVKKPGAVKRVILCAGKVFYDLQNARPANDKLAIVRAEQLYPFPHDAALEVLARYPNTDEVVWCQEEPKNQGAWYQIKHNIEACTDKRLVYAGRPASASPATGYYAIHQEEQAALVKQALSPGQD